MVASGRVPTFDLLLLGVAIVAISTSAPLIAGAAAPTLAIAFWRNALALPVLGAWVLGRAPERAAWRGRTRDEKRLTGLAGLLLGAHRSEEHTSELQSLMRISYAVFCLKKKKHSQFSSRLRNLTSN